MSLMTAYASRFEVLRDTEKCISCGRCIQECAHGVHQFYKDTKNLTADEKRCSQLLPVRGHLSHQGAENHPKPGRPSTPAATGASTTAGRSTSRRRAAGSSCPAWGR